MLVYVGLCLKINLKFINKFYTHTNLFTKFYTNN